MDSNQQRLAGFLKMMDSENAEFRERLLNNMIPPNYCLPTNELWARELRTRYKEYTGGKWPEQGKALDP
jgi:hypothetical protein